MTVNKALPGVTHCRGGVIHRHNRYVVPWCFQNSFGTSGEQGVISLWFAKPTVGEPAELSVHAPSLSKVKSVLGKTRH